MYDVIVVGARCAGSPVSMLLARKGYRVLVVDRATFPSDSLSTHYIWPPGVDRLKRWGLLDKLRASNCPPIRKVTFDAGPVVLKGSLPPCGETSECYAPRRTVLDKILVDAAVQAGAELREGFSVREIVTDGDRVTGIRGHSKAGSMASETARIVIGADGIHSLVAQTVKAPEYAAKPSLTCLYYGYWRNLPVDGAEIHSRPGRFIAAAPTNEGLVMMVVAWPNGEFHTYRSDIEANYRKTIEVAPELASRLAGAKREERFAGTAEAPNYFRKPYGNGWALVGDAGYHKDPITAQGISDAFRDAELLASAIDDGFSGREPSGEALEAYELQRNESAMPMYGFTCQLALMSPPPPEMQQLFGALEGNQADTDQFLGTIAGTTPIPEFYSPENMQRIIAKASSP